MAKLRISLRGLKNILQAALPLVEAGSKDPKDPKAPGAVAPESEVERLLGVYRGMKPEAPKGSAGVHGIKGRPETPPITKDYKGRDVQAPYLLPKQFQSMKPVPRAVLAQRSPRAVAELPDHPGQIYIHNNIPIYVPQESHMKTMVWAELPAKGEKMINNPDFDPNDPRLDRDSPKFDEAYAKTVPRKIPNPKFKPAQPAKWRLPEELGAAGREQLQRVKTGERQVLDPRDIGKVKRPSEWDPSAPEKGLEAKPHGQSMWDPSGGLDIGGWSEMMGSVPGATQEMPGRGGGLPSPAAQAAAKAATQAQRRQLDPSSMSLKQLRDIRTTAFKRYQDSRMASDKRVLDQIDAAIAARETGEAPKRIVQAQQPVTTKEVPTQVTTRGMRSKPWRSQAPEIQRVTRPKK